MAGFSLRRPDLGPEDQAKEGLKQDLRDRLRICRVRLDSARMLKSSHRYRGCFLLLHSLFSEALDILVLLARKQTASHESGTATHGGLAIRAKALGDGEVETLYKSVDEQTEKCDGAKVGSKEERRQVKKLLGLAPKIVGLCTRRLSAAETSSLATPMDNHRSRMRGVGWAVLGVVAILAGLVLWGPLGNILGVRSVDVIQVIDSPYVALENVSEPESSAVVRWRWGLGPETRLTFALDQDQEVEAVLRFVSYLYLEYEIEVNGEQVAFADDVFPKGLFNEELRFMGQEGINEIVIRYSDWNHKADQAPQDDDPRPLAVAFVRLKITAQEPCVALDQPIPPRFTRACQRPLSWTGGVFC